MTTETQSGQQEITMLFQSDYFNAYRSLKLTRDDKGVLVAEFNSNGGLAL